MTTDVLLKLTPPQIEMFLAFYKVVYRKALVDVLDAECHTDSVLDLVNELQQKEWGEVVNEFRIHENTV